MFIRKRRFRSKNGTSEYWDLVHKGKIIANIGKPEKLAGILVSIRELRKSLKSHNPQTYQNSLKKLLNSIGVDDRSHAKMMQTSS